MCKYCGRCEKQIATFCTDWKPIVAGKMNKKMGKAASGLAHNCC